MKIEIKCGRKGKDSLMGGPIPWAREVVVKVDGKDITGTLNYFYFAVPRPDGPVYWSYGLRSEIGLVNSVKRLFASVRVRIRIYLSRTGWLQ